MEKSEFESEITNTDTPEEVEKQNANAFLELQHPDVMKETLRKLQNNEAVLEISNENGREVAKVKRHSDKQDIFMTNEESEIALLKNPVAGLKFLNDLSSEHFEVKEN
jgi:hypothetical protein